MTNPPKTLIDDICWCWWTRPRAVRIGDTAYFAALDSHGSMLAATLDLKTGVSKKSILATFEPDDHNNPAMVVEAGKPLVAFYSRHDEDDALRIRISKRPLDISEWGDEQVLKFNGITTYAEVHARGDELHLFTRADETRWGFSRSLDWGRTWSTPRDFLAFDTDQQVYMATVLLPDRRTVRMAVSGHPKEYEKKPLHDVWAALIDLETGAVRLPSGEVPIANLFTGEGLPINYSRLELVAKTPDDRTANLLDVGDGPVWEVGFVSKLKDDFSTTDARNHVASLRGGKWIVEDVTPAGAKFGYIDAGFYVGGLAFPEVSPGGRVFVAREQSGLWTLERYDRGSDGMWAPTLLLGPSATRLTRPWAMTNAGGGIDVVALALEHYGDSYFGTKSHLVGASSP